MTIAAVTGIAVLLKQPLTVGLVAGMGIAMSSTAIGLAILGEKNLLGTPGGQASFSVLLFQDLAVIPLLVLLPALALSKGAISARHCTTASKTSPGGSRTAVAPSPAAGKGL